MAIFGRDQYGRDPFGPSAFGDNFSTVAPFGSFLGQLDSDLAFIVDARPWGYEEVSELETGLGSSFSYSLDFFPVQFLTTPITFTDGIETCQTFGTVGQSVANRMDIEDITDLGVTIGNIAVRGDQNGTLGIVWPGGAPQSGEVTTVYRKGVIVERGYQDYERPLIFRDTDRVFPANVKVAVVTRNDAFVGVGSSQSSGGTSANCELILADGQHDEWADGQLHIDGRQITILLGGRDFRFVEFQPVFSGLGQTKSFSEDSVQMVLRDSAEILATPLQTTLYLGDEDSEFETLEGGDGIAGRRKPRCFGECKNIPLVLVNRVHLCYQFNDGPIEAVDAVYDKGIALTVQPDGTSPDTNFPPGSIQRLNFTDVFDWDDVSDPVIDAGFYIYDLDNGIIRVNAGAGEDGTLTADVKGDNEDTDLGVDGYVEKIGDLIRRIVSIEGTINKVSDVDLDTLDDLQAEQPAKLQSYYDGSSTTTVLQAIDTLIASIGGMREVTREGLLTARIFKFDTPVTVLDPSTIITLVSNSTNVPTSVPINKVVVSYAQSYIVQLDVLPGLDPEDPVVIAHKEFVAQPFRLALAPASGGVITQSTIDLTKTRRPLSVELEVDTKLIDVVDAEVEAQRRLDLLEPDYQHYDVLVKDQRFLRSVGDTVTIVYNRFGLEAGRDFIILGIDEDSNTLLTRLRVWGGLL